jgi:hypothetical protein
MSVIYEENGRLCPYRKSDNNNYDDIIRITAYVFEKITILSFNLNVKYSYILVIRFIFIQIEGWVVMPCSVCGRVFRVVTMCSVVACSYHNTVCGP